MTLLRHEWSRWLIVVSLLLPAALLRAEVAPFAEPAALHRLLQDTGLLTQIEALPALVQQELAHLEASRLFSPEEIAQVRTFMAPLQEVHLQHEVRAAIARDVSGPMLVTLQSSQQRAPWRFLLQAEQALTAPARQEQLQLYALQVRARPPLASRLALMQTLDTARGQRALAVTLRVALRKQLLAALARVKTGQSPAETALENELHPFRDQLAETLAQKATTTYLYLYRNTPTGQVEATVALFQDPHYRRFMEICEQALQQSLQLAQVNHP